MIDMTTRFGALTFSSPVLLASGTCGYASELSDLIDFSRVGGIVTKGISPKPRLGNPIPRMCETAAGMINSIGLENVGVTGFAETKAPALRELGTAVIVNFFGETFDEYVACAEKLSSLRAGFLAGYALEMNISCPNIKKGGVEFGTDPAVAGDLVRACRAVCDVPLWVKLTPNITDVVALARAVVDAGADGLSIINTITAMAINARTRRPRIATVFGGLSGPAIKPIALRMVYQVARENLGVPICGIGGIASAEDAAEFLIAGADAVQIGTQTFAEPGAAARITTELAKLGHDLGVSKIGDLVGSLRADQAPSCAG